MRRRAASTTHTDRFVPLLHSLFRLFAQCFCLHRLLCHLASATACDTLSSEGCLYSLHLLDSGGNSLHRSRIRPSSGSRPQLAGSSSKCTKGCYQSANAHTAFVSQPCHRHGFRTHTSKHWPGVSQLTLSSWDVSSGSLARFRNLMCSLFSAAWDLNFCFSVSEPGFAAAAVAFFC